MRAARRAGYAAWVWVVVFTAFHIYWFTGGRFGLAGQIPPATFDMYGLVVAAMFAIGAVVPLAVVQSWGRRIPRWMLLTALWTGCVLLALRGGLGLIDETLRVTGISPNGLTGLTREQVTGTAHPSASLLWAGRATDTYFTLGGLLFGITARSYPRALHSGPRDRPQGSCE
jgi:hypothetical protein